MPGRAGGVDRGPRRFVFGGAPISGVRVSVEGLHGETRAAVLAAAANLRDAPTLGALDERLKVAASDVAAVAANRGEEAAVEVSPGGPGDENVYVSFRQPHGWQIGVDAGLGPRMQESCLGIRSEASGPGGKLGGLFSLGRDAAAAGLMVSPVRVAGLAPVLELAARGAELTGASGPRQTAYTAALAVADPTGCHSVRLQAAAREMVPNKTSLSLFCAPMRTTKTSLEYGFCTDTRPGEATGSTGELRHVSAEVAGFLGDVSLARAEGLWSFSQRLRGGGLCTFSASGGLAMPLGGKEGWNLDDKTAASKGLSSLPVEDRFFLGGAVGGPAERLPGFADRCAGPAAKPAGSSGAEESIHLGGEARLSVSASAWWPIPECRGLQFLAFGSAGTLAGKAKGNPNVLGHLANQARASVGVGLGVPLPNGGFFGLTYAKPFLAQQDDRLRPLQLWLSFNSPM